MAKRTYTGVSSKARRVKRGSVGIANKARKISRAYIGVGGKARPCWNSGVFTSYGAITPLSSVRSATPAGAIGNYAVFAGFRTNAVDAYNTSLTRQTLDAAPSSNVERSCVAPNHVLFERDCTAVFAYDRSLTRSFPTGPASKHDQDNGGWVGGYGLFIGGLNNSAADAYDAVLTRTSHTVLCVGRGYTMCASTPTHVIVSNGHNNSWSSPCAYVDAINADLTSTRLADSTVTDYLSGSTDVGQYGLICTRASNYKVEAYDASLTRTFPTPLTVTPVRKWGTHLEDFGLLPPQDSAVMEYYDKNLVKQSIATVTGHGCTASVTVGDFAIIAGGDSTAAAEAFTIV